MGYDLHITRKKHWAGEGAGIAAEEWLALVRSDPELQLRPENGPCFASWCGRSDAEERWLDWTGGNIYSRRPDAALIDKMMAIAARFGATLQGDDGEIYQSGSQPPREPARSLMDRIFGWFRRESRQTPRIEHSDLPFGVGDRVQDAWGNQYTVTEIDPKAEHGAGIIRARREDGSTHAYMMLAHGLTPVERRIGIEK